MKKTTFTNSNQSMKEYPFIQENNSSYLQISQGSSDCIGEFDDAPSYMLNNEYIRSGYRLRHHKPRRIIKSLFKMHN